MSSIYILLSQRLSVSGSQGLDAINLQMKYRNKIPASVFWDFENIRPPRLSMNDWIDNFYAFISRCGYRVESTNLLILLIGFFAIGNRSENESIFHLGSCLTAIDVHDHTPQAADNAIIQKMLQVTALPIASTHTIILISGDHDFYETVKEVQRRGRKVLLIHHNCIYNRTSHKLLEAADLQSSFEDILRG